MVYSIVECVGSILDGQNCFEIILQHTLNVEAFAGLGLHLFACVCSVHCIVCSLHTVQKKIEQRDTFAMLSFILFLSLVEMFELQQFQLEYHNNVYHYCLFPDQKNQCLNNSVLYRLWTRLICLSTAYSNCVMHVKRQYEYANSDTINKY